MDGHPLMKKLQLKERALSLINLPEELKEAFPPEAERVSEMPDNPEAVLGFASTREELAALIHTVLPKIHKDTVLWMAYPKKTSQRYRSDITRDQGWSPLYEYNYEPVSQVALDEDWSALRFKPLAAIVNPVRKERMVKKEG